MLNNSKLIAFTATNNPAKCVHFYTDILGLKFVRNEEYALVFDSNGTELRIAKLGIHKPVDFTVLGWQVKDIKSMVRKLANRGVKMIFYEGIPQDELGICKFPDGSKVAWFHDPDGNLLSLTENK